MVMSCDESSREYIIMLSVPSPYATSFSWLSSHDGWPPIRLHIRLWWENASYVETGRNIVDIEEKERAKSLLQSVLKQLCGLESSQTIMYLERFVYFLRYDRKPNPCILLVFCLPDSGWQSMILMLMLTLVSLSDCQYDSPTFLRTWFKCPYWPKSSRSYYLFIILLAEGLTGGLKINRKCDINLTLRI